MVATTGVDTTIVPFLNADGKPYQYVAIRNDITDLKLGEERIRQQAALLDQAQTRFSFETSITLSSFGIKELNEFTAGWQKKRLAKTQMIS